MLIGSVNPKLDIYKKTLKIYLLYYHYAIFPFTKVYVSTNTAVNNLTTYYTHLNLYRKESYGFVYKILHRTN